MGNKILQLVIAVVLIGLTGWFLDWVMVKLGFAAIIVTVVWILFGLLVLLGIAGLFGYGPLAGQFWKTPPV